MKRFLLWFGCLGLVLGAFGVACGGETPRETTSQEIADSLSNFYSIVYDRPEIAEGEFEQWPQQGDPVSINATISRVWVHREVEKEVHDERVVVRTECDIQGTIDPNPVENTVLMDLNGKTIELPIYYFFDLYGDIDCEKTDTIGQIHEGDEVVIEGEVLLGGFSICQDGRCGQRSYKEDKDLPYNLPRNVNYGVDITKLHLEKIVSVCVEEINDIRVGDCKD